MDSEPLWLSARLVMASLPWCCGVWRVEEGRQVVLRQGLALYLGLRSGLESGLEPL